MSPSASLNVSISWYFSSGTLSELKMYEVAVSGFVNSRHRFSIFIRCTKVVRSDDFLFVPQPFHPVLNLSNKGA